MKKYKCLECHYLPAKGNRVTRGEYAGKQDQPLCRTCNLKFHVTDRINFSKRKGGVINEQKLREILVKGRLTKEEITLLDETLWVAKSGSWARPFVYRLLEEVLYYREEQEYMFGKQNE